MTPGWRKRAAVALFVDVLGSAAIGVLDHFVRVSTFVVFAFVAVFAVVFVPWIVEGAWPWNLVGKRGSE